MSIIKLESKNIRTLALFSAINFIGTALLIWFRKSDYFIYMPHEANPYILALKPLIYMALPLLVLVSFILGIFTISREENSIGRWQAVFLTLVTLIFAYIYSFSTGAAGGW